MTGRPVLLNPNALRAVAGAGLVLVLASVAGALRSPLVSALRRGEPVVGVLLGTDLAENAPHSDTLMVWRYDPRAVRLDVLSIPRDTKIDLPGYRFHRINEIFAYHVGSLKNIGDAARKVMEAVPQILPPSDVLIPRYFFQVDYDGFRRMIDRLGGVTVTVDEPMHYDDNAGRFHFHKEPGVYRMGGTDALGYVRYRGRSGDRGRILRQMEFLRALLKRSTSPTFYWRLPGALAEVGRAVHSNVRIWEWPFLLGEVKRLRASDVNPWLLPGKPRRAYWEMDAERTSYVLGQMAKGAAPETVEPGSTDESSVYEGTPVLEAGAAPTVKVWNASGRAGLALTVTRRLRQKGFDVVEWGTYTARQTKSRVVDRSGRFDPAREVAEALGLVDPYSDADPALRTDVEVVLGEDFVEFPE